MKPTSYIAAARHLRALADRIEATANAETPREKQARTRAVNAAAHATRLLAAKNANREQETTMQQLVHLALSPTGRVMAHFDLSSDAADYCLRNDYTHVPYNLNNRDKAPAPLIGTVYRA